MPLISCVRCNACSFRFPTGAGRYIYAIDANGKRVECPHPVEFDEAKRVTGLDWHLAKSQGLLGFVSHCVCFDCAMTCDLDVERDEKKCPSCGSLKLQTVNAAIGAKCPQCRSGVLIEEPVGIS
jgi:hypothetical protein